MNDLVLVTGATGLIGRHVVRRLLEAGRRVRVLAREPRRLDADVLGRAQVVEGDVRSERAVLRAARGARTVLHLAACARAWSRDPVEFAEVNILGVERLLRAARLYGVERIVHTSTVLTLPALRREVAAGRREPTPYEETKLAGDRLVESYLASGGDAVVVHPTRVYGPGPLNDANGVTRIIALYLHQPLLVRLADRDVLANYVHVDDVAAGILLAAERGARGGHYVLGGENISFRALLELVGELAGTRRPVLRLPPAAALALVGLAELWGKVGGTVPLTAAWIRAYLEDQRVDVTPTCRELNYRYRPLHQGIEETIRWLREERRAAS